MTEGRDGWLSSRDTRVVGRRRAVGWLWATLSCASVRFCMSTLCGPSPGEGRPQRRRPLPRVQKQQRKRSEAVAGRWGPGWADGRRRESSGIPRALTPPPVRVMTILI